MIFQDTCKSNIPQVIIYSNSGSLFNFINRWIYNDLYSWWIEVIAGIKFGLSDITAIFIFSLLRTCVFRVETNIHFKTIYWQNIIARIKWSVLSKLKIRMLRVYFKYILWWNFQSTSTLVTLFCCIRTGLGPELFWLINIFLLFLTVSLYRWNYSR